MLLLSVVCCLASAEVNAKCDLHDLQRCTSCGGLSKTVDLAEPDQGEYYRGAYWNGLYAAFRLNCPAVGKKLLENHANPNLGGVGGSFLASLLSSWPHNNETINKQWVDILRHYPLNVDWKNPYTKQSAREMVANKTISVAYPEIWRALVSVSRNSP